MTRADSDAYMSLTRHLLELRARLLLSLAGILVGAIGAWFLYTPATTWLTRPLASAGASGINFRTIIGPFSTHITFALWAGFILTTPWWLTQLWLFIAPALTRTEKRRTALIAIPSAILFLAGVASALWFLPHAVSLLLSELPQGTSALLDFDSYISFVVILTLVIGASFLFPMIITPATTWLTRPLASAGASGINFRTIIGPFSTHITFALWAGFILTTPWWLTQLWLFIAPALTRTEKRRTALIAIPSAILFLAGVASALWFLPHAVSLLLSELPQGTSALLDFDSYISFVVILTLVIGASFLFPMIIIGIHALGLASTGQILRHWRWAVVGATVFAAITNPLPDLWSMILQMCALLALYFGAIGVCWLRDLLARRRQRKREAAPSLDPTAA